MMQNAVNESFWDGLGVEIEGRSIFEKKIKLFGKIAPGEKIAFSMLWVAMFP